MNDLIQHYKKNKSLYLILLLGIVVRLLFTLFIAEKYFNRNDIFTDNDTGAWTHSFINLVSSGIYTSHPDSEYGYFTRMPGYSFFIGLFYLLTGGNMDIAYPLIGWFQMLLDCFAIYLVWLTANQLFNNRNTALTVSLLYALYPFIIVWNPVVYSELLGIFFMLACLYFISSPGRFHFSLAGLFAGLAILTRPQFLILAPVILVFLFIQYRKQIRFYIRSALAFSFFLMIVYGSWPLRNYINHKKLIFTQDLRACANWNTDVISFMQYIFSVKAEWEPQFSYILHNQPVTFPREAYINKTDSVKLMQVVELCKQCGSGFSNWNGYWKTPVTVNNCNEEISRIFTELRQNQIKYNAWNFYVSVPAQNLKKALFKTSLYDTGSVIRRIASLLFYYRSFLILLGIIGGALLIRRKNVFAWIFILFFLALYISLCLGTGVQFRNIEMRYFLPADVLLLFPAGYFLHDMYRSWKEGKNRIFKK